jgi:hypothetical protein
MRKAGGIFGLLETMVSTAFGGGFINNDWIQVP